MNQEYSNYFWSPRITFGGLLDVPNENGETKNQGPVIAFGIDLLNNNSRQAELWELDRKLVQGRLPTHLDEALISNKLAKKLDLNIGDKATFIGKNQKLTIIGNVSLHQNANIIMGDKLILDLEKGIASIVGSVKTIINPNGKIE